MNGVVFSNSGGWEYTPGPKEIDIQTWSTDLKTYVNEYVSYLKEETGDTSISGDLITMTELGNLGCTISDDYSYNSDSTCANTSNASWLVNGQKWWTRSADAAYVNRVWYVHTDGHLTSTHSSNGSRGVRPVITIDKADL